MTFSSKVSILKKDSYIFRLFTVGIIKKGRPFLKIFQERRFPADYRIFSILTKFKSRMLICPLPGFSTHGEVNYLSPLVNWEQFIDIDS